MNSKLRLAFPAMLPLALLALSAGCSRHDTNDARAKLDHAYTEAKTAVADAWQDVKSYTFEKRHDFSASAKALNAKMDAEAAELRANYSDAKASASRRAAMEELKNSQADFHAKVDALGNATADTWDSAKENVVASWNRLQEAYYKARSD